MLAPLAAYFNANRTTLQNSVQIENGWQIAISVHSSQHYYDPEFIRKASIQSINSGDSATIITMHKFVR